MDQSNDAYLHVLSVNSSDYLYVVCSWDSSLRHGMDEPGIWLQYPARVNHCFLHHLCRRRTFMSNENRQFLPETKATEGCWTIFPFIYWRCYEACTYTATLPVLVPLLLSDDKQNSIPHTSSSGQVHHSRWIYSSGHRLLCRQLLRHCCTAHNADSSLLACSFTLQARSDPHDTSIAQSVCP